MAVKLYLRVKCCLGYFGLLNVSVIKPIPTTGKDITLKDLSIPIIIRFVVQIEIVVVCLRVYKRIQIIICNYFSHYRLSYEWRLLQLKLLLHPFNIVRNRLSVVSQKQHPQYINNKSLISQPPSPSFNYTHVCRANSLSQQNRDDQNDVLQVVYRKRHWIIAGNYRCRLYLMRITAEIDGTRQTRAKKTHEE